MGNSGVLISQVIYTKETIHGKKFVICDAAMNDLIRPALYDAFHRIWPVNTSIKMPEVENPDKTEVKKGLELVDIVGPVCESSDTFATPRALPKVKEGDLLAIFSAGAYGFTMSSVTIPVRARVKCWWMVTSFVSLGNVRRMKI